MRGDHAETGLAQRLGRDLADPLVILDQQHGRARDRRHLGRHRRRRHRPYRRLVALGQIECHQRADARRALQRDMAAELAHEAEYLRQAEAGAAADRLRREERLEGAITHLGRHAVAVVAHRQRDVAAGLRVRIAAQPGGIQRRPPRRDRDRAAARHGIARVQRQIQQRGFQLRGIGPPRRQVLLEIELERHRLAERALDQRREALHQLVHV